MRGSKPSGNQPKTAKVAKGLITIGQVVGSFGLQGWLKVEPLTDFPERFAPGAVVCLKGRDHVVETRSVHKGQIRLKLEGISTPEQAEAVRWEMLTVPKTSRPTLAEGEYLSKDLIGLLVLNVDGREVGIIDEIIPTPANDLMRIQDALIPLVSRFVKEVNLENGTMTVDLIPGLFPGDEAEEVR